MNWRFGLNLLIAALAAHCLVILQAAPALAQIAGGGGSAGTSGGQTGQSGGQSGQTGASGNTSGGIYVDAQGVVRAMFQQDKSGRLDKKRRHELAGRSLPGDLNDYSSLRKVSLVALEAACETYARDRKHVSSEMQFLAGLQRIDYVFVYPEEQDIVIAGPAEGYVVDGSGRAIGNSTGRPALRLDDLMVALRALERGGGAIRCSIDPTAENLAKLAAFAARNSGPATLEEAKLQFEQLGDVLGMQNISLSGIPVESHFAELLVEADIRMKRVSVGVDTLPVKGFHSHLAMVGPGANSVERWWFTPLYDAFIKTADGLAFELGGQRVQLLSQDELVSSTGQRTSAPFTRLTTKKFSKQFTDRYAEVAKVVPVFAELQSLFDLAIVAALIKKECLDKRVDWPMSLFLDAQRATIVKRNVPRQIHSVSNYKVIGKGVFVSQVTGGVVIDPWQVVRHNEYQTDSTGNLREIHDEAAAATRQRPGDHRWWWD
jgi:hypothetical protein